MVILIDTCNVSLTFMSANGSPPGEFQPLVLLDMFPNDTGSSEVELFPPNGVPKVSFPPRVLLPPRVLFPASVSLPLDVLLNLNGSLEFSSSSGETLMRVLLLG